MSCGPREHQCDAKVAVCVLAPWLLKVSLTDTTNLYGYVTGDDHLW